MFFHGSVRDGHGDKGRVQTDSRSAGKADAGNASLQREAGALAESDQVGTTYSRRISQRRNLYRNFLAHRPQGNRHFQHAISKKKKQSLARKQQACRKPNGFCKETREAHCTEAQPFRFFICLSRRFSLMRVLFSSSRPISSMTEHKVEHLCFDARICNSTVTHRLFSGPTRESLQRWFLSVQSSLTFKLRFVEHNTCSIQANIGTMRHDRPEMRHHFSFNVKI